jgi:phytoene synthase
MALEDASIKEDFFSTDSPATDLASAEDYTYCHQVMLGASNNYSFASNFLPSDKRPHVDALYAFLRIGDDRVDVSHDGFNSPLEAIEDWESVYWKAFENGDSPHPVMRAYLATALTCDIPAKTMKSYFRAMKEDLVKTRFDNFGELLHYMDGSAVPVGRAMTYILGVEAPYTYAEALQHADALSIGMQLSNFWRDIGQDWQIGRVYIPQEDMHAHGVGEADLAAGKVKPNFIELLEFEIERAEDYYNTARDGIPMLASGQWGVMSGLLLYESILTSIRANKYDVFSQRARTNLAQKILLIANAWLKIGNRTK